MGVGEGSAAPGDDCATVLPRLEAALLANTSPKPHSAGASTQPPHSPGASRALEPPAATAAAATSTTLAGMLPPSCWGVVMSGRAPRDHEFLDLFHVFGLHRPANIVGERTSPGAQMTAGTDFLRLRQAAKSFHSEVDATAAVDDMNSTDWAGEWITCTLHIPTPPLLSPS